MIATDPSPADRTLRDVLTAIGLAANLTYGSGLFLDVDGTELEVLRAVLDGILKDGPGVSEDFFRVNCAERVEINRPFGDQNHFTLEEFYVAPSRHELSVSYVQNDIPFCRGIRHVLSIPCRDVFDCRSLYRTLGNFGFQFGDLIV